MPRKKGQKVTRCRVCEARITITPMQKKIFIAIVWLLTLYPRKVK